MCTEVTGETKGRQNPVYSIASNTLRRENRRSKTERAEGETDDRHEGIMMKEEEVPYNCVCVK